MMGYTHIVIGAAGAVGLAASAGYTTPDAYILASSFGALGGAALDIDVKNHFSNPTMTDSLRSMLACVGLMVIGFVLDIVLRTGVIATILTEKSYAVGGLAVFLVLMGIGHFTEHRTFTHSLLFVIITTICIGLIHVNAASYYLVGCLLHLILDMLNNKVSNHGMNHGIWLLYPLKFRKGIALGLCRSDRDANKAFYFIGLGLFVAGTVYFVMKAGSISKSIAQIVILIYVVVVMHFVREKSEREVRHIMHMHGEL